MIMDEVLYSIAERVKNFAVIYLVDISEVPDFNKMYELYDPCTVMFFYRNKHFMIDLGTGNNKINWPLEDKVAQVTANPEPRGPIPHSHNTQLRPSEVPAAVAACTTERGCAGAADDGDGPTENGDGERCAGTTAATVEADGINGIRASIRLLQKASPTPVPPPLPPPDPAITPPPPTVLSDTVENDDMDRIIDTRPGGGVPGC
ncbi:hypothetical protein HK405_010463 [Cladochytrium tenue]|nr:hypothetical protein HK405_010463 [Cladochytrium tenue]